MQFVFIVLLALPVTTALECIVGGSIGDVGVFEPIKCTPEVQYCYTMDVTLLGVHTVTRSCDPGFICKGSGVFDQPGGTLLCCKLDDCNADKAQPTPSKPSGPPLECVVGGSINDDGVFAPEPCLSSAQYCFTMDVTIDGVHTVSKSCDPGFICKGEGLFDQYGGHIFCCRGKDCNSASRMSLLMTILAAAAAIWQRL